jgi:murein DD-endopeptidase MepM/ murein hydrolase activator NlpD
MKYDYANATGNGAMLRELLDGYDSSGDYWRVTSDGRLINDGQGYLKDEDGYYVYQDGSRGKDESKAIGAGGIETGLLNILFGGTSGRSYDDFNNFQVAIAQSLMIGAGMKIMNEDEKDYRKLQWDKSASGQELNMNNAMLLTGNSIASEVFARYYDSTTDSIIAKSYGKNIGDVIAMDVSNLSSERFLDLYFAKTDFYNSIGALVNGDAELSGEYGEYLTDGNGNRAENYQDFYKGYENKHFGIDLASKASPEILAAISGRVLDTFKDTGDGKGNGNWAIINYGYNFEQTQVATGIMGEYLHLKNSSDLAKGQLVDSSTVIGIMGNTGNSLGDHLHYSMYTAGTNTYSGSVMKMILGKNYEASSIARISGGKIVYDPTILYTKSSRPNNYWLTY